MMRTVLATLCLAVVVSGEVFDCTNYQPGGPCTLDAIPFCLTNGTTLLGRCDAQRAVCAENKMIDESFAACSKEKTMVDCSQYNPMICPRDLISFCLTNGTVMHGSCAMRKAVCEDNRKVDDRFAACNQASAGNNARSNADDGGNGASTISISATLSLIIAAFYLSLHS